MTGISRRGILAGTGGAALGAALSGCSGSTDFDDEKSKSSAGSGKLRWWDHFGPLRPLQKKTFKKYADSPHGEKVEYTQRNGSELGQALQLAKRSHELPDVSSLAGLDLPIPRLIKSGWLQPIELSDDAMERLKGDLYKGVHIFDGKLYSFPVFSFRQYDPAVWINTKLVDKAGLDADKPPATYDEFRSAARTVKKKTGDGTYGCIIKGGMTDSLSAEASAMAQAGGFNGGGGVLYRNGQYAYHAEQYLNWVEFLRSLRKDKLLRPGSLNWNGKVARAHWESDEAGFYLDGPWSAGAVMSDSKQGSKKFAKSLGVGPVLVPEKHMDPVCYSPQKGGSFWLHKSSSQADAVNRLFSDFIITDKYNQGLAEAMDQPPRELDAVNDSSALKSYKELLKMFDEQVYVAPNELVKNPDTAKVQAETKQIEPDLGHIIQGALTGDVKNVKKSLKGLSDKASKERDRALKAAKKKGADVNVEDYSFPNWESHKDYTEDKYEN